jgi:hypothetical protein
VQQQDSSDSCPAAGSIEDMLNPLPHVYNARCVYRHVSAAFRSDSNEHRFKTTPSQFQELAMPMLQHAMAAVCHKAEQHSAPAHPPHHL